MINFPGSPPYTLWITYATPSVPSENLPPPLGENNDWSLTQPVCLFLFIGICPSIISTSYHMRRFLGASSYLGCEWQDEILWCQIALYIFSLWCYALLCLIEKKKIEKKNLTNLNLVFWYSDHCMIHIKPNNDELELTYSFSFAFFSKGR